MNFPPPTDKQSRVIWTALTGLGIAAIVALVVGLVWGLGFVLNVLAPVLWPVAVAGVLACLLDPVVDFIERRHVPRTRAIILVFAMALFFILGLFGSVAPQVVAQTGQLVFQIPGYAAKVEKRVEHWGSNPPALLREFLQREIPVDSTAG
jgi:predicted PurR-regulated permease PerM